MSEEEFLNVLGPFFEEEVVEEEGGEVLKSQKSRGSPHLVKPYVPKAEHDGVRTNLKGTEGRRAGRALMSLVLDPCDLLFMVPS